MTLDRDHGSEGHFDERLSLYLDGELPEEERRRVEAHLEECDRCRQLASELETLVGRAGRLPDREPGEDLWPKIAAEIEEESRSVPLFRRELRLGVPTLAAAAAAVAVTASALTWSLVGDGVPGGGDASPSAPVATADGPVADGRGAAGYGEPSLASAAVPRGVMELEARYREARAALDPETRQMLDENLRLVDRAIAEAERALADRPDNVYLRQHLTRTVRRKAKVLTLAVRMTEAD